MGMENSLLLMRGDFKYYCLLQPKNPVVIPKMLFPVEVLVEFFHGGKVFGRFF